MALDPEQTRNLLDEMLNDEVEEQTAIEDLPAIEEKFFNTLQRHGSEFAQLKGQLFIISQQLRGLRRDMKKDKGYETYSDFEFLQAEFGDLLADAYIIQSTYEDNLGRYKTALFNQTISDHKTIKSAEMAIELALDPYIEAIGRSSNFLKSMTAKQKVNEKLATHIKDYFFNEQNGVTRTS